MSSCLFISQAFWVICSLCPHVVFPLLSSFFHFISQSLFHTTAHPVSSFALSSLHSHYRASSSCLLHSVFIPQFRIFTFIPSSLHVEAFFSHLPTYFSLSLSLCIQRKISLYISLNGSCFLFLRPSSFLIFYIQYCLCCPFLIMLFLFLVIIFHLSTRFPPSRPFLVFVCSSFPIPPPPPPFPCYFPFCCCHLFCLIYHSVFSVVPLHVFHNLPLPFFTALDLASSLIMSPFCPSNPSLLLYGSSFILISSFFRHCLSWSVSLVNVIQSSHSSFTLFLFPPSFSVLAFLLLPFPLTLP